MELELGFGFSNSIPKIVPILKELDLISYVNGKANQFYDDVSCLSTQNSSNHDDDDDDHNDHETDDDGVICMKKNRVFSEVESSVSDVPQTLPLLLWDKDPNDENKYPANRQCQFTSFYFPRNEGVGIVGWPPIKSYRKKLCRPDNFHRHLCHQRGNNLAQNGGSCGGIRSMYVKVQMEGYGITRKIDLKLYHSFDSLTSTLLTMFDKGKNDVNDYKLTYQDREGEWLLAGDVPWRTFINLVQRLKMTRRED